MNGPLLCAYLLCPCWLCSPTGGCRHVRLCRASLYTPSLPSSLLFQSKHVCSRSIGSRIDSGMRFFVAFTVLYACAILYLKRACWRDPTSIFFENERAHIPGYSAERISQADTYINETPLTPTVKWNPTRRPAICVGVASVQRDGISYLKSTIGSLQEGLSQEERESLYFVTLLAHTDQAQHQDHAQPWLLEAIDRLPTYYDNQDRLRLARALELNGSHNLKAKFDYSILLEECAEANPLFTMIVEDDVVALDG